jgi:adenine specific DNA methylase Mod
MAKQSSNTNLHKAKNNKKDPAKKANRDHQRHITVTKTIGWEKTCEHNFEDDIVRPIVLDMFSGVGTTGIVAIENGRNYLGIELNKHFATMSRRDLSQVNPLCATEGIIFDV